MYVCMHYYSCMTSFLHFLIHTACIRTCKKESYTPVCMHKNKIIFMYTYMATGVYIFIFAFSDMYFLIMTVSCSRNMQLLLDLMYA